jgi:hypothetical protein
MQLTTYTAHFCTSTSVPGSFGVGNVSVACNWGLTLAVDPVAVAILEALVLTLHLIAATTAASILGMGVRQGSNIPPSSLRHNSSSSSTATPVSRTLGNRPARGAAAA